MKFFYIKIFIHILLHVFTHIQYFIHSHTINQIIGRFKENGVVDFPNCCFIKDKISAYKLSNLIDIPVFIVNSQIETTIEI